MEVTVYTKPNCQGCRGTIRQLTTAGIPFTTKPLDDQVLEAALELDITSAPIVVARLDGQTQDQWWGGFRPDRIAALKSAA